MINEYSIKFYCFHDSTISPEKIKHSAFIIRHSLTSPESQKTATNHYLFFAATICNRGKDSDKD
jgi:xylose isomerase